MPQGAMILSGSFTTVVIFDNDTEATHVLFEHPDATRFSCVSDEVITGHPLFGRGLCPYGLFKVVNSPWIDELQKCDAVHPQFDSGHWRLAHHYVLCFKDRMCEVVTTFEPMWKSFLTRAEALRSAVGLCGET